MISIRKLLETTTLINESEADSGSICDTPVSAFRAVLQSVGTHGSRAVPTLGPVLEPAVNRIIGALSSPSSGWISQAPRMVEEELSQWADKAQENRAKDEQTLRDLLLLVAESTKSTGTRDEKFTRDISVLSDRLRSVAGLESLPVIRRLIMENTRSLDDKVARMAEESREAIRRLTSEVAEYQSRLAISERRALLDPLTGLSNRRGFEQQLDLRVKLRQPFSLLVADLNGFKAVNDRHGHTAGDEVIKSVATVFRQQFTPDETVARWGGDEFVAIVNGAPQEGQERADRVLQRVLGEHRILLGTKTILVNVDAAMGVMPWNGAESALELFTRTDKEMYRVKQSRWHSAKPANAPVSAAPVPVGP